MKKIALLLIQFYQRFISPYKGFSCAHRVATGEVSCSGYGAKVIEKYGLIKGYALLNRRFFDCKWCSEKLKAEKRRHKEDCRCNHESQVYRGLKYQQGFVDCGGCDLPGCDLPDCGSCDIPTPSCSCDIPTPNCNVCDFTRFASNNCFNYSDCVPDGCGSNKSSGETTQKFKEKRKRRNEKKYGTGNPDEVIGNEKPEDKS